MLKHNIAVMSCFYVSVHCSKKDSLKDSFAGLKSSLPKLVWDTLQMSPSYCYGNGLSHETVQPFPGPSLCYLAVNSLRSRAPRPFASSRSPKRIVREGLEEIRT